MRDKEIAGSDARKKELEMLAVKREADSLFQRNEEEKRTRKYEEMRGLQGFHAAQMVSMFTSTHSSHAAKVALM